MEVTKWLGLKNTTSSARLKPGHLEVALDVDIDSDGVLRSRVGQTLVSAAPSHSLFAAGGVCLVMQGNVMKRMTESGALSSVATLDSAAPVSYAEHNGVIYFSNGSATGRVVAGASREWGVRNPAGNPAAAPGFGLLPPGRYLYAITYLRSDGIESGAPLPGLIELAAQGGIALTGIPTSSDPDVVGSVLYLSAPNGTELYQVAAIPAGSSSYAYGNAGLDLGPPLHPDPASPPPAADAVEVHAGVAYAVVGDTAYASDQYSLERFRLGRRFLRLPGQITLFRAVDNGIYAGTSKGVWFFEGTDPEEMRARKVLEAGAVPGTSAKLDAGEQQAGDEPDDPSSTPAIFWMSTNGIVFGDSRGQVTKVTQDDFGIPVGRRGAAMVRLQGGNVTYVATTRGNDAAGNQHA